MDKLIVFNDVDQQVDYGGNKILLPKTEFLILGRLANRFGLPVNRELLHREVSQSRSKSLRTIDSHVSHLRNKLRLLTKGELEIKQVYGSGYVLQKWTSITEASRKRQAKA